MQNGELENLGVVSNWIVMLKLIQRDTFGAHLAWFVNLGVRRLQAYIVAANFTGEES